MKKGSKVRTTFDGKVGISKGPIFALSVWWILVQWPDGREAMVKEQFLEVIDADR